jgi:hypothetical protein
VRVLLRLPHHSDIVHTTILDTVPDIDIDGTVEQALSTLEIGNDGVGNISFGKPVSKRILSLFLEFLLFHSFSYQTSYLIQSLLDEHLLE